jgi:hypothetical protein
MSETLNLGNGNWAVKKDSLLGYNSENGNFKPLPFDFTRASSATVVNKDGLIETVGSGEPRIDFSNDAKGALLLEPTRSNLITNSNNLTTWNGAAMTRSLVNDLINPSNGLDASKLTQTSSGGYAWLSRTFTGNETFSAFVKKDSSNFVRLYAANNTVYFDIVNGTVETAVGSSITDKSIIDYGNGWFRVSMSVNSTDASYVRIYPASTVDSSSGTNSLFVYGAQLEQGSYATSYIPTSGSAVTRIADACNNGGNDQVINSTEGVLYAEISALADDNTSKRISVSDSTANNHISIDVSEYTDTIIGRVRSSNIEYAFMVVGGINQKNTNKIALKYKSNDCSLFINGSKLATDTSVTMPIGLSELSIDKGQNSNPFYGNIKEIKLYNTALTDSELAALTTI